MRSDRCAFTGDLGGNPLGKFADASIVDKQWIFRLAKGIDESRRDDTSVCINDFCCLSAIKFADGNDAIALHSDICCEPWSAATIQNVAVLDENVECWALR